MFALIRSHFIGSALKTADEQAQNYPPSSASLVRQVGKLTIIEPFAFFFSRDLAHALAEMSFKFCS